MRKYGQEGVFFFFFTQLLWNANKMIKIKAGINDSICIILSMLAISCMV